MGFELTYVALRQLKVGGQVREKGALVPEATTWHNVEAYVRGGYIAPVPKATVDSDELAQAEQTWAERATPEEREEPEPKDEPESEPTIEGFSKAELRKLASDQGIATDGRWSLERLYTTVFAEDTDEEVSEPSEE
jgi:hypothetical protein